MILANPFVHDTRVYKQARSLIEWGADVHVVAMKAPGLPDEDTMDGIHVHRVGGLRTDVRRLPAAVLLWPFGRGPLRRLLEPAPLAEDPKPPRPSKAAELPPVAPPPVAPPPVVANTVAEPSPAPKHGGLVRQLKHAGGRRLRTVVPRALREPSRLTRRRIHGLSRRTWRAVRNRSRLTRRRIHGLSRRTWHAIRNRYRRVRNQIRRRRAQSIQFVRRTSRRLVPRHPMLTLFPFNLAAARRAHALAPDLIECHDLNTLLAGLAVRRLRGLPLIYDSHELWLHRNIGDRSRRWDSLGWAWVERFGIRRADAVFTVAEGICRHLERQYHLDDVTLIRNVQPWEPPAPRSTLLAKELGLDPATQIVIYPGAITINRGLEQMIDAAAFADNAVFVVMGYARNPAYLAGLHDRARANGTLGRRVLFRDAVPIDDVGRYVASATLGIVPTANACLSYYFESSNKIFHCVMAGVPIVASDHAEKRLLVERHDIGRLFDETDPRDIAGVIEETLADAEALARMRASCLAAARTLNWENEEHRLRTVVAGLIGDRLPPVPPARLPGKVEAVVGIIPAKNTVAAETDQPEVSRD